MPAAAPLITQSEYLPGCDFSILARLKDAATGSDLLRANITSITYKVWPRTNPRSIATSTLNKADVFFDTLQTGAAWDNVNYPDGYNFLWTVPGTLVPKENETYRIVIIVVCSGRTLAFIVDHRTLPWN